MHAIVFWELSLGMDNEVLKEGFGYKRRSLYLRLIIRKNDNEKSCRIA